MELDYDYSCVVQLVIMDLTLSSLYTVFMIICFKSKNFIIDTLLIIMLLVNFTLGITCLMIVLHFV